VRKEDGIEEQWGASGRKPGLLARGMCRIGDVESGGTERPYLVPENRGGGAEKGFILAEELVRGGKSQALGGGTGLSWGIAKVRPT